MMEPVEMPMRGSDGDEGGSEQLSILLSSATAMVDEEFKRGERLDAKSRNQITIAGTFFALAQAVVIGLINGSLAATETQDRSSFVLWLAVAGGVAAVALAVALLLSYRTWQLRKDSVLEPETIRDYIEQARKGNPAVGIKLIGAYAQIAEERREKNEERAEQLEDAGLACIVALAFTAAELILAFVAVAIQ